MDEGLTGLKLSYAITAKGGETVVAQGKKITSSLFKEIQKAKIQQVEVAANDLEGAYVVADVVDMSTGEVLIDANSELTTTGARQADRGRHRGVRNLLPRARRSGHGDFRHHQQGRRSRPRTKR